MRWSLRCKVCRRGRYSITYGQGRGGWARREGAGLLPSGFAQFPAPLAVVSRLPKGWVW